MMWRLVIYLTILLACISLNARAQGLSAKKVLARIEKAKYKPLVRYIEHHGYVDNGLRTACGMGNSFSGHYFKPKNDNDLLPNISLIKTTLTDNSYYFNWSDTTTVSYIKFTKELYALGFNQTKIREDKDEDNVIEQIVRFYESKKHPNISLLIIHGISGAHEGDYSVGFYKNCTAKPAVSY